MTLEVALTLCPGNQSSLKTEAIGSFDPHSGCLYPSHRARQDTSQVDEEVSSDESAMNVRMKSNPS